MSMARVDRRARPSAAAMNQVAKKRKRTEPEDEEIDSDEVDGPFVSENETAAAPPSPPVEDENETVEQKRLRLAQAYLGRLGVDIDDDLAGEGYAAKSDDEEEDGESEGAEDSVNAQLQQDALRARGVLTTELADTVSEQLPSVSVTHLRGHSLPPTCVALAAREEAVAVSGGKDSRVIVWDISVGQKRGSYKASEEWRYKKNPVRAAGHIGNICTVAVSDDAAIAASGGADGLVRVWDLRAGKLIESLRGHRGPVNGLQFRAGTRQLYSASSDRTVKIWDLAEMAYVETLFGHGSPAQGVDILSRERALSCGQDGTVRLYKIVEGSQLVFRKALTCSIDAVSMVNEQRFISGGDDGAVCMWFANKKKPVASIQNAHGRSTGCESWISAVRAFPYSDLAVSGAGDGILRFWKCETTPSLTACGTLDIGPGFVNGISISSNRAVLVAAVGSEHRLGRWSRIRQARNGIRVARFIGTDQHK